jgi:rhodanese-related sulfurtransferase
MNRLPRVLLDALLVAALGATIGLAVNHRLVFDAFAGRVASSSQATETGQARLPQPVLLAEVRELLAAGALPVDAREATFFSEGHLPGAISLPLGEFGTQLPEFQQRADPGKPLVLYCNGYGCPDSFDLGMFLLNAGYRDVRVYEGGFPEWRDAGLPVEGGRR